MQGIFTIELPGRNVFCVGLLIDCITNQSLPNHKDSDAWNGYQIFIVQRSQNALGKWPVLVMPPICTSTELARYSGFRVHAVCCSYRPDDPEIIEYGILVWHQNEIQVIAAPPFAVAVNWPEFAEAVEM